MSGLLLGGCGMCHLMTAGHAHILFVSWRSFCVPTGLSPACDLSLAMSHLSTDRTRPPCGAARTALARTELSGFRSHSIISVSRGLEVNQAGQLPRIQHVGATTMRGFATRVPKTVKF